MLKWNLLYLCNAAPQGNGLIKLTHHDKTKNRAQGSKIVRAEKQPKIHY